MNQNSSFIDILKGFNANPEKQQNSTSAQSESKREIWSHIPRCESLELCIFPTRKPNSGSIQSIQTRAPIKSMRCGEERTPRYQAEGAAQRHSGTKDSKINLGLNSKTLGSTNSQNLHSRSNQIMFQIKLKLASFVTKFNIDSKCLSNLRQQSIESLLEMVFKKFKDYTKQHETLVKNHHQILKCKQIQILNQKSELINLQQIYCQETNKWSKAKEKLKEENINAQKLLQEKISLCEETQQSVYMLEAIIKEQNQYIKQLEQEKSNKINQKTEALQSQLSILLSKYSTLQRETQSLNQEIAKLNQEINTAIEQNKLYKNQAMQAKEQRDRLRNDLEQNEEKLLIYYDMLMKETTSSAKMREEILELSNKNDQLLQQIQKNEDLMSELEKIKENRAAEKQLNMKQIEAWKMQCSLKQSQIMKLRKALSSFSLNKSLPLQKKARSQIETPEQTYTINIKSESHIEKEKEQEAEKAQQEEKMKKIIEEWRKQMERTVEYYENYIQKLQSQIQAS